MCQLALCQLALCLSLAVILNSTSQVVISLCNHFIFLDALNNMKMKYHTHLMCVRLIVLLQIVKQLLQSLIFSDVSVRRMSGGAGVMIIAVSKDVLDEVLGLDAPAVLVYGTAGLRRCAQEQTASRSHGEEILHLQPLRAAEVPQQLLQMIH